MKAFAGNSSPKKKGPRTRKPRKPGPKKKPRGKPLYATPPGGEPDPRINRFGRPKSYAEFQAKMQEHYEGPALKALVSVLESPWSKGTELVNAALGVLAYSRGKPVQAVELSGPGGAPIQTEEKGPNLKALTVEELKVWRELYSKATADSGGA